MTYDVTGLSPFKRHWLLKSSNIPRRFLGMEPSDIKTGVFPATVEDWVQDMVDGAVIRQIGGIGVTGVGLLFDGTPGIGKTTHAVVAAMEFIRRLPEDHDEMRKVLDVDAAVFGIKTRPVLYLSYPEFMAKKKAVFDADPDEARALLDEMDGIHGRSKNDWLNVRLLILDDLGKEYSTKYTDASFDEILRSRYDRGLPTIVTTNVALKDWAMEYTEAMASFAKEAFHQVRIVGPDQRGAE